MSRSIGSFFALVSLAIAASAQPPNDNFAKATSLTGFSGWAQGSNTHASVEAGEPRHLGTNGPFGQSVWWRWTAPDHGLWKPDLSRLPTNTAFSIYTGSSVSNLTLLASNRFVSGVAAGVRVAAGTEYFIAVDHTNDVLVDFGFSLAPAPINDFFTNRTILLGQTGSVVATTVNASTEPGEPAAFSSPTVWWTWTAPVTGPTTFQFPDSNFILQAYTNNSLGTLRELTGLDFNSFALNRYTLQARVGGTYQFRVQPRFSPGPFNFIWFTSAALVPPNNNLAGRTLISGTNVAVNGSLTASTREVNEPNHGGGGNGSVWYGWKAPANGSVQFTLDASGSVVAAVYRGTNYGALTAVASGVYWYVFPQPTFNVVGGADYSIAVDGSFISDVFGFTIAFTPAATNDNFANRIPLLGNNLTTSGTTRGAGKESGEPNHAGSTSRSSSIWWTWVTDASGPVTISAQGTQTDPVLAVYTGTQVQALTAIASNNDYLPGVGDSRVTFNAVAGTSYHIAVATTLVGANNLTLQLQRNIPTVVTWLQPTNDLILALGSSVDLMADATDSDGGVAGVEIRDGTNVLASLTAPPYQISLTNLDYGTYALRAFATDNEGLVGVSTQRQVRVPPPNDYFDSSFIISQDTLSVTSTMSGVTRDANEPRQLSGAARVAWWSWVAPTNGTVHLAITNLNGNSHAVSVYSGTALGALTLVGTSAGGTRATFVAMAGTEYQIAAEGSSGGPVIISFFTPAFAPNDHFTNAIPISGTNAVVTGSNIEATAEPREPNHGGYQNGRSLWWTWTAPTNGVVSLKTDGSAFDTTLGVYTGTSVSNLTLVVSNSTSASQGNSAVSFTAVPGTTYRIAVDRYFGSGDIVLTLGFFTVPANDLFSQRIPLTGRTNLVSGNNTAAARETGEPDPSIFAADKTLWWSWTAPVSGHAIISTEGSSVLNVIAVYTGNSLGTLSSIMSLVNLISRTNIGTFNAVAGVAYHLQLDSRSGIPGDLALRILQPDNAPNDAFAQSIPLSGYLTDVLGNNFNASREANEPFHDTSQHRTVWWTWTAPETRSVSVRPAGRETPRVAVYTGADLAALSQIATNYPDGSSARAATFNAVEGSQYHFAFFLPFSGMGDFEFGIVPNEPPVVQLASPAPGAVFYPGQNIPLLASAADADGSISNVQFTTAGFTRTVLTNPYATTLSNLALGDYTVSTRAIDNLGGYGFAPAVNIRVAPPNDGFANAVLLTGTTAEAAATNIGAAKELDEPNHGSQPGGRSIWFSWVAPVAGIFALSTEGSSFDTLLGVYTGESVSNLTLVAQNDNRNAYDTWSEVQFAATLGTTYFIAVDGRDNASGEVLLALNSVANNDLFTNAVSLEGSTTLRVRNLGAGEEPAEPANGLQARSSLWWTWTAPSTGRYLATTAGSDFDTVLAIYTGKTLSNLNLLAVDDDGGGNRNSVVRFDAIAGEQYQIAVSGYGEAEGNVQLTIATNGVPTLFDAGKTTPTNFTFRALAEPGKTNIAQRSATLSNWSSFKTNIAAGWWTDFQDASTNTMMFYRVTQP